MILAWRNLSHDRLRFFVTIIGIAFAVFLMIFQGSLLTGFIRASSWLTAPGPPGYLRSMKSRWRFHPQGLRW